MRTFTLAASIAVFSAFCALPALADVPPPEGYVETCTVDKQATATTECLSCRVYYGATTRCQTMLEPFCHSKVCRSYGSSGWNEIFCRSKNASAPVVPQAIINALPLATDPAPSVPNPGACPGNTSTGTATVATGTGMGTGTAATSAGTGTVTAATGTGTATTATGTGTGTVTAATSTGTGTGAVTAVTSTGTGAATAATSTGTGTAVSVNPEAEKKDDSGCSYGSGNVLRTLGPWSIALVGVLLAALRRRRK
jgi:hypothetical protein